LDVPDSSQKNSALSVPNCTGLGAGVSTGWPPFVNGTARSRNHSYVAKPTPDPDSNASTSDKGYCYGFKPLGWIQSARSEKETVRLFRKPWNNPRLLPSSDSSGRRRYRSHLARWGQIGWDALEIGPEKETAANQSKYNPIPLSRLEVLGCDQATVAMRPCAGLAGVELALLARRGTTCGTSDSEYLLRGEFFFHSRGRILQAL
jgi:hypothetical protein